MQRVGKVVRLSVLLSILAGLTWLQKNPQYRNQVVQALLVGKDWLLSKTRVLGSR